ncbi:MAG TPA: hypothetical protein VK610_08080 [Rhodothermales bacterium]|nr:hypothetical protein [Rhodothermales bacterium]
MIAKALDIVRTDGLLALASRGAGLLYRRGVRPLMPTRRPVYYAGLPIAHTRKWGDGVVPARWLGVTVEDLPGYEEALIKGLQTYVEPGDHVVVVGGGLGVTAAAAALRATASGRVDCYEGGQERLRQIRLTAQRNGVEDRVTVHHAVVARSVLVVGTEPASGVLPPASLPACDVLELDCDGAEVELLREMTIRPRVVLVETHGFLGTPTALVASLLEAMGYAVTDLGLAEPRLAAFCEANDIRVLVGTPSGAA